MYLRLSSIALIVSACGTSEVTTSDSPLTIRCASDRGTVPQGEWICGEDRTLECRTQRTLTSPLFVIGPSSATCDELVFDEPVVLTEPGPQVVSVFDGSALVCESRLTVVDRTPPRFTSHSLELWPPDHTMRTFTPADCVTVIDDCDPSVRVVFTTVTSDEPLDGNGDGNTEVDMSVDCDQVSLRAERAGPSNGRVYTLGWRATDASGNEVEGTCAVAVDHDRGDHPAVAGPSAHWIDAPHCL